MSAFLIRTVPAPPGRAGMAQDVEAIRQGWRAPAEPIVAPTLFMHADPDSVAPFGHAECYAEAMAEADPDVWPGPARLFLLALRAETSVTFQPLALMSIYTASKAPVNAFSESVALELEPLGVRVRIVIPGRAPETPFGANARGRMGTTIPDAYAGVAAQLFARFQAGGPITTSHDVAEAVWRAVTDPWRPMRLPAGADAIARRRRPG